MHFDINCTGLGCILSILSNLIDFVLKRTTMSEAWSLKKQLISTRSPSDRDDEAEGSVKANLKLTTFLFEDSAT